MAPTAVADCLEKKLPLMRPEEKLSRLLGRAVQFRRRALRISQEELGARSGLHRTYISDVERGTRSVTVSTLFKLARSLQLAPSVFVGYAETCMASENSAEKEELLLNQLFTPPPTAFPSMENHSEPSRI